MTNKDLLCAFPVNFTDEDLDTLHTLTITGEDIPDTLLNDLQHMVDNEEENE